MKSFAILICAALTLSACAHEPKYVPKPTNPDREAPENPPSKEAPKGQPR